MENIKDSGREIVLSACSAPFIQILQNAGLKKEDFVLSERMDCGINVATGETSNLIEAGIIDPVKVVKEALQNAASVAITILKCETLICDAPEVK